MANDDCTYTVWLNKLKLKDDFMNSSCYAAVSMGLKNICGRSGPFQMPYFILDEELRREHNNLREMTSLRPDEKCTYVSPALRQLLIYTLELCDPIKSVNTSNYMNVLRSFLNRPSILPKDITNPIGSSSIAFHILPTECKLYILNVLFHQTPKVIDSCTYLGSDSLRQKYNLAQDGRVFVALKKSLDGGDSNKFSEFDPKILEVEQWGDLYRFVMEEMPQWKLVAETEMEWDVLEVKLTSFKEIELWARMRSHKRTALSSRAISVNEVNRSKERQIFSDYLDKVLTEKREKGIKVKDGKDKRNRDKIPDDPTPEKQKKILSELERLERVKKDMEKKLRDLKLGSSSTSSSTVTEESSKRGIRKKKSVMNSLVRGEVKDMKTENRKKEKSSSDESNIDEDNKLIGKKQERCRFWPNCRESNEGCEYIHPQTKCKRMPYCPYGSACIFLHGKCRNDGVCTREACPYEHYLRRIGCRPPCKYGASCKTPACSFAHPSVCTRRSCPGSDNCSFYHPPNPFRVRGRRN